MTPQYSDLIFNIFTPPLQIVIAAIISVIFSSFIVDQRCVSFPGSNPLSHHSQLPSYILHYILFQLYALFFSSQTRPFLEHPFLVKSSHFQLDHPFLVRNIHFQLDNHSKLDTPIPSQKDPFLTFKCTKHSYQTFKCTKFKHTPHIHAYTPIHR